MTIAWEPLPAVVEAPSQSAETKTPEARQFVTHRQLDLIAAGIRASRGWGACLGDWPNLRPDLKRWFRAEALEILERAGISIQPKVRTALSLDLPSNWRDLL